ncbi:MAG: hypothetical protein NVSMB6_31990 [Burkholderiaceae bacterium]
MRLFIQSYTDSIFAMIFGPALTFTKAVPSNPTATAQFLQAKGVCALALSLLLDEARSIDPAKHDAPFGDVFAW